MRKGNFRAGHKCLTNKALETVETCKVQLTFAQ